MTICHQLKLKVQAEKNHLIDVVNIEGMFRTIIYRFDENKTVAKMLGHTAKISKKDLEKNLGKSIGTKDNRLNYQYLNNNQIESK